MGQCVLVLVVTVVLAASLTATRADCPDPHPAVVLRPTIGNRYVSVGMAIAADDETVALTDRNYSSTSGQGAVAVFRRNGDSWAQEALLLPPGTGMFGEWLDLEGSRLFASGYLSGSPYVHIYERIGSMPGAMWVLRDSVAIRLMGTDPRCGSRPSDGAVRASGDEVLVVPGSVWCDRSMLYRIVEDPSPRLVFNTLLAIPSLDYTGEPAANVDFKGDTIVVQRRVYRRTNGNWALEAQLPGLSGPTRERTIAVSLDADGNAVALGNNWESGFGIVGYVQVYRRTPGGTWVHEVTLEHPSQTDPSSNPGFGFSVALLGNRLAVGALKDDFAGPDAGAVFMYARVEGVWQGRGSFGPTDAPGAWTGFALQITPNRVIAASLGLDGVGGGVVFDACSVTGPGDSTPRCLPGALGLLTFIEAFFSADPFADFNRNGLVSVQDLFDFLAAWFAGCP